MPYRTNFVWRLGWARHYARAGEQSFHDQLRVGVSALRGEGGEEGPNEGGAEPGDRVADWLRRVSIEQALEAGTTFEDFFADAPVNPNASLITGVVCGIRVEDIEDPLMQKIRYLDKLVDELAKGKAMHKVLRAVPAE